MNLDSTTADADLFSGITYDGGKGFLPLTNLDVQVSIIDTSGRVTFSQTYFYDDSAILQNSFYLFPIPYDAIICGFDMRMSGMNDAVYIQGLVRQLDEESLSDYRRILGDDDDILHIIEQSKRDMLVLSLGSFLPRTEITISLTYAIDLFDSKESAVHFQFPSYIGRYTPKGATSPRTHHDSPVKSISLPAVSINLDIEMPGEILYVYSNLPLQNIPLPFLENPKCTARKQFTSSKTVLDTGFLVGIQALGLDHSRCFVDEFQGTAALSLNVVPYMDFSQERDDCEYIFLIDRSWSMCMDDKMEQTKQAMKVLLKTLPIESTWFNIYSFEHSYDSLWPKSQQFNQVTLHEALNFISHLDPRGGTEVFSVFQAALVNRRTDITTKIFMLTDGEIHYPQWTIDLVTHAAQNASQIAPVKIFTVAIGSAASDVLCEGLAKAGNGSCSKTRDGENPMRKCTNVLNQMVLNDIHDMKINWNVDGIVYQAPIDLSYHPTGRVSVKAIIPADSVPETVSILGKTSKGSLIHYEIPVRWVQRFHRPSSILSNRITNSWPASHIIGAHNLSLDMERIGMPFITNWDNLTPSSQFSRIKEELLRLGMQYNIINSMSTFVAVDSVEETHSNPILDCISPIHINNPDPPSDLPQLVTCPSSPDSNGNMESSQSSDISSLDDTESRPSTPMSNTSSLLMPGTFPHPSSSRKAFIVRTESVPDTGPDETYIFPSVPPTYFVAPPLKHQKIVISYSSPIRMFVRSLSMGQDKGAWSTATDNAIILDSVEDDPEFNEKFIDLIEMQCYDGSFSDLRRLSHLIECPYDDDIPIYSKDVAVPSLIHSEALWATALAIKFLKKRYPQKWVVWKDLARKSTAWGSRVCGGDSTTFESIITHLQLSL